MSAARLLQAELAGVRELHRAHAVHDQIEDHIAHKLGPQHTGHHGRALFAHGHSGVGDSAPATVAVPSGVGEWEQRTADGGREYWFNRATEQSQWSQPSHSPDLVSGWERRTTDDGAAQVYYYHAGTGTSQWELPAACGALADDAWEERVATDGVHHFWFNAMTNVSQWEPPVGFVAAADPTAGGEREVDEWTRRTTEDGTEYFVSSQSGESQWARPPQWAGGAQTPTVLAQHARHHHRSDIEKRAEEAEEVARQARAHLEEARARRDAFATAQTELASHEAGRDLFLGATAARAASPMTAGAASTEQRFSNGSRAAVPPVRDDVGQRGRALFGSGGSVSDADVGQKGRAVPDWAATGRELTELEAAVFHHHSGVPVKPRAVAAPPQSASASPADDGATARDTIWTEVLDHKYRWHHYERIRSPHDFTRGVVLNRSRAKVNQKVWQKSVILHSMTVVPSDDLDERAVRIHKYILRYCGDQAMGRESRAEKLASDILTECLAKRALCDETLVQLCKQLTDNPEKRSEYRAWQLLCMCVGCFGPTADFEMHLLNFILGHEDNIGKVGLYARYALSCLEETLDGGGSTVPALGALAAYAARPPILATIELIDGALLTEELTVPPHLNVAKLLAFCVDAVGVTDRRRSQFGIFVVDVAVQQGRASAADAHASSDLPARHAHAPPHADLPIAPRALSDEEFLGDVCMHKLFERKPFKLVFMRKLYLRDDDAPSRTDDKFNRLVYIQAVEAMFAGALVLRDEETVLRLATQTIAVDLGDRFPISVTGLLDAECMDYIPASWRAQNAPAEWAAMILQARPHATRMEKVALQDAVVATLKTNALYGSRFFSVKKAKCDSAVAAAPYRMVRVFPNPRLPPLHSPPHIVLRSRLRPSTMRRTASTHSQRRLTLLNPQRQPMRPSFRLWHAIAADFTYSTARVSFCARFSTPM